MPVIPPLCLQVGHIILFPARLTLPTRLMAGLRVTSRLSVRPTPPPLPGKLGPSSLAAVGEAAACRGEGLRRPGRGGRSSVGTPARAADVLSPL